MSEKKKMTLDDLIKSDGPPSPRPDRMSDEITSEYQEVADAISVGLKYLGNGNAATQMGAIEGHAVAVKEAADTIAAALRDVADAIERTINQVE